MQRCTAPSVTGVRSYMIYVQGSDFVIVGDTVANSTREHCLRVDGADRVLIAYNDLNNLDRARPEAIGLHQGPSLLDYRIQTSMDVPDITSSIVESLDPIGPYGAKEAGEGPLHPAIPAIANAIWRATGARMRTMPFTPERVLAAIKAANAGDAP
jgi:hypothetical protein